MGWESALVYDLSGLFGGRAGRPGSPLWPPAIGREKLRIAGERANESILSEVGQQPPQAGCDTVTSWKRSNRRRQIAGSHLANFPAGFIRSNAASRPCSPELELCRYSKHVCLYVPPVPCVDAISSHELTSLTGIPAGDGLLPKWYVLICARVSTRRADHKHFSSQAASRCDHGTLQLGPKFRNHCPYQENLFKVHSRCASR